VTTLFLFIAAFAVDFYMARVVNLKTYAERIEQYLRLQEGEISDLIADRAFIRRQLNPASSSQEQKLEDFKRLESLSEQTFNLVVYKEDTLAFWLNNTALPVLNGLSIEAPKKEYQFKVLRNGHYELIKQSFIDQEVGKYTVYGVIPIKYAFELESNYLRDRFATEDYIPHMVEINEASEGQEVIGPDGDPFFYIHSTTPLIDKQWQVRVLWMYFFAFLSLTILFTHIAMRISMIQQPWMGAAFLGVSLLGTRMFTEVVGFTNRFSNLEVFEQSINNVFFNSLGDLFINIVLLLWLMLYFHKNFQLESISQRSKQERFFWTVLHYLSIHFGILLIIHVFKDLVFKTNITFDFQNIFSFNSLTVLTIVAIILLLLALFLFGHRTLYTVTRIGLNQNERLGAVLLATAIFVPVLMASEVVLSMAYILLICVVLILVFDMFVDYRKFSFVWLVVWLIFLSAFPSVLLYKYTEYKDHYTREQYAQALADLRDTRAEQSLIELRRSLESDQFIKEMIAHPFLPFQFIKEQIKRQTNRFYSNDNYLFYNYAYDIYAFNRDGKTVIDNTAYTFDQIQAKITDSEAFPSEGLAYYTGPGESESLYYLQLSIPIRNNPNNPLYVVLEFDRKRREQSKVYTEILIEKQYKELPGLSKYDYAIYQNNQMIDSESNLYGNTLNLSEEELPEIGGYTEVTPGNRSEIVYRHDDDTVVIIGREREDFFKVVSFFSYIFALLMLIALIMAAVNTFIRILPDSFSFSVGKRSSLRSRIQFSVITLIIISFAIIGFVTIVFFQSSSESYHEKRLDRKKNSIITNINIEYRAQEQYEEFFSEDYELFLQKIIRPLSKIHRLDINFYDVNGNLLGSSEEDIFNKGIIERRMSQAAYFALTQLNQSDYVNNQERVGQLVYKAAFVPLKDPKTNQIKAFVELPYYSNQRNLKSEVTVFMGTLLNVYVFLLLIAGVIAILVANSITGQLSKIREKLKNFRLGKRNEKLVWQNNDEVGELVGCYNEMIEELDRSADKLKASERESAWRDMAKQVAHEIKNPLTPMKLSIQYLQHSYKRNPEKIEPLLKRVTATLVEQIDTLSHIASEFSTFAKMPKAENQRIVINNLVQNIFSLFRNNDNDHSLSLHLPDEQYTVFADKTQLIRVFTNLIKNATQAIPVDRHGEIEVSLTAHNGIATISVKDNGVGIPEDQREKVFVPHFTTKSSGSGIGLAMTKSIIESVSGDIYFKSREDGPGTIFFVELPIV